MKRLGKVWDKIIDIDNIKLAIRKAARGKKHRRSVARVINDIDKYAIKLQGILASGSYHTSTYKLQTIYEPKERLIYMLPFFPDRVVHHAITNILEDYWDKKFIYASYSCRKHKGQHRGSSKCMEYTRKYKYCLKCDISKFYPSVDHAVLKRILREKIKDTKLLTLLDEVIDSVNSCGTTPVGKNVPIGNMLSQWFGNLYMNKFDMWIKHTKHIHSYIRYCDDFILFSNSREELEILKEEIKVFLAEELMLTLSKANIIPVSRGIDFLGYRHFPKFVLIRKRVIKRIKRVLGRLQRGVRYPEEHIQGMLDSYSGYLRWCNSYTFRSKAQYILDNCNIPDTITTRFVMRGYPKNLNTREDVLYVVENFPVTEWEPDLLNMITSAKDWFCTGTLEKPEDGVVDDTHKVVTSDDSMGTVTHSQFEMMFNPDAKLFKFGFSEDEVNQMIALARR